MSAELKSSVIAGLLQLLIDPQNGHDHPDQHARSGTNVYLAAETMANLS